MKNSVSQNGLALATVDIEGMPYFKAADVCRILELPDTNDTYTLLAEEHFRLVAGEKGKAGEVERYISEAGLYFLMGRSDTESAVEFTNWAIQEVMPAIHETGGYLLNEHARQTARQDKRAGDPFKGEGKVGLSWLFEDVIPAIRATGGYLLPDRFPRHAV